jgi:uncharacterized protein (TIGR02246 family)
MKALTTLFVVGIFLMPAVLADDVDDVKAEMERYLAALNAGDANAYIQHFMPETSAMVGTGLISRSHSLEEQKNAFVASGLKRNLQFRHLEVKVYGNTAVVTGYVVGSVITPDGTTSQSRGLRTGVMIKQGGQWKEVHQHRSPLIIAPSQ